MKTRLRAHYKTIRNQITPADCLAKSRLITRLLMASPQWTTSSNVMIYLSMADEVQTDMILEQGWLSDKNMIIPLCQKTEKTIMLSLLTDSSVLRPGAYGIRELPSDARQPVDPVLIDLCLIPGLAFDRLGNRLGFGAGYYDRFLPNLTPTTPKIALAFSEQIAETCLPTDQYDCPMDYILTEQGFLTCEKFS